MCLDRGLLLTDVKIVSDLRPVFSMVGADKVEAFTIIHTLVVDCYDRDVSKKFHIALDMSDIEKLKKAVDRAKSKEKALSKFVGAAGIAKIEID